MNKRLCLVLALFSGLAQAVDPVSVSFFHKDWELACDNTRTCRAAGYQSDENMERPVSVLFTRKAGPQQPVLAELKLGDYGDGEGKQAPTPAKLSMKIDQKNLGQVAINQQELTGQLSAAQTAALLAALERSSVIEWTGAGRSWALSDKGAAAVLLKMDEFQGRLGTTGALIKKGSRNESAVLPALPAPLVVAAAVPKAGEKLLSTAQSQALIKSLLAQFKDADDCDMLIAGQDNKPEYSVARLSSSKLLFSALCWRAAYNQGYGHWVINAAPPFNPTLVTVMAESYQHDGRLFAAMKGRGIGDCWSTEDWTWDGKTFVHTSASTTGMCKLVAAGGAWELPTLVTEVRKAGGKQK